MSSFPIALQEILLATDFCEPARLALASAKQIARRRAVPLRVVHVLDLTDSALSAGDAAGWRSFSLAHDSAERALREIRRELRLAGIENAATLVSAGKPAAALRERVHRDHPSLLILGLKGARTRKPHHLGATARPLLADPPCPVLTVNEHCPESPAAGALERLVIVVDATPNSLQAALDAWPPGPRQPSPTIFAVLPPDAQPTWEIPTALRRRFHPIRLDHAQALDAVLRHATEAGASLIIAAFGRGTNLSSLTRGSLANTLLAQAPCPVLTVRA
ncbi:MAG TPA: universal stress protein [Acidobacteriaceae bacterium]|nr:universal stress protein [Acidobacteriaceae bacterium]